MDYIIIMTASIIFTVLEMVFLIVFELYEDEDKGTNMFLICIFNLFLTFLCLSEGAYNSALAFSLLLNVIVVKRIILY